MEYRKTVKPRTIRTEDKILREIIPNCQQRHKFFKKRIAKTWDTLPEEIKFSSTIKKFKIKID